MTDPITSWSTFALAVLSFVAVGISYWGIRRQTSAFASSVSADLCLKLLEKFDSASMLQTRRDAAAALKSKSNMELADDVFDFFEVVGLYVRRGVIDKELAHSMFFHWANLYWQAGRDQIAHLRQRSTDLYSDFEFLYEALLRVEMKNAPKSRDINLSEGEIELLLDQEVNL